MLRHVENAVRPVRLTNLKSLEIGYPISSDTVPAAREVPNWPFSRK